MQNSNVKCQVLIRTVEQQGAPADTVEVIHYLDIDLSKEQLKLVEKSDNKLVLEVVSNTISSPAELKNL